MCRNCNCTREDHANPNNTKDKINVSVPPKVNERPQQQISINDELNIPPASKERNRPCVSPKGEIRSAKEDEKNLTEDRRNSKEDRRNSTEDRKNSKEDRMSPMGDRKSSKEERKSSKEDRRSPMGDRKSSTEDRRDSKEDRRSLIGDRKSSRGDRKSSRDDRKSSREDRISSGEDRKSSGEDRSLKEHNSKGGTETVKIRIRTDPKERLKLAAQEKRKSELNFTELDSMIDELLDEKVREGNNSQDNVSIVYFFVFLISE